MSDNEIASGSGRFESTAKWIGVVGGLIAVMSGIHQLWTSNVQNARELSWRQASMAREIVNTMMSDDGWQAFEMMDWDDKGREYTVNGEALKLNAQSVYNALEHDESTETDHFILTSCGRACPGIDLRIADESGNKVEVGQHGELVARGANIMRGYWNNPEETERAFRDGMFRTGDVGYQDAEAYVYILDRLKDMIVTGGQKVFSAEVEAEIYELPDVREVASSEYRIRSGAKQ